jgi:hypothetical protein
MSQIGQERSDVFAPESGPTYVAALAATRNGLPCLLATSRSDWPPMIDARQLNEQQKACGVIVVCAPAPIRGMTLGHSRCRGFAQP